MDYFLVYKTDCSIFEKLNMNLREYFHFTRSIKFVILDLMLGKAGQILEHVVLVCHFF